MAVVYPFKLITPNCPDGFQFRSLETLLSFLADNVNSKVEIIVKYPI